MSNWTSMNNDFHLQNTFEYLYFPLVDLSLCKVMGDLQYRRVMLFIYVNYNIRYKETDSIMINTFCIKWYGINDEPYIVTGNVFRIL